MSNNRDARLDFEPLVSELLPCPFCGEGETKIDRATHWLGTRSEHLSTRIMHWCSRREGQPQSILQVAGKTDADAVALWNSRSL